MHTERMKQYHETLMKISCAHNTGSPHILTGDALRQLKDIIDNTGPLNPLHLKAEELRDAIIQMDNLPNSRKPESTPATILAFPLRKK